MYAYRNPSVCSLKLAATFPFREDIKVLRSSNYIYNYELLYASYVASDISTTNSFSLTLYAPCVASDISTTNSFSRRAACDKLGLSVKGAGIAVGDD